MIRRYQYLPEVYAARRQQLMAQLPPESLALVVAHDKMPRSADQFFPYQFNTNLFYLTGIEHPDVVLLLWKGADQTAEIIFYPPYDEHQAVWEGNVLTDEEIVKRAGELTLMPRDRFWPSFHAYAVGARACYVEYNQHPRFFSEVPSAALRYARRIRQQHPALPLRPLYPVLARMRMIKDEHEQAFLQQANDVAGKAFRALMGALPSLAFEHEVEALLYYNIISGGGEGFAFDPIVAGGKNATILHYTNNNAPLRPGSLLLIDFGATVHGYHSDITRVLPVGGCFSQRQRAVYEAVRHIQHRLMDAMRPGITIKELNERAGEWTTEALLRLGLLTEEAVRQDPRAYRRFFMHGFGHHLGLDVHDAGDATVPLAPGMVLTCEPGIYIPEENIGVRLENNILITPSGSKNLSENIPILPDEICEGLRRGQT